MPLSQVEQDSKFFGFYWRFALSFDVNHELLNDVETTSSVRNNDHCSLRTKGYYTVSLTSVPSVMWSTRSAWLAISGA